MGPLKKGLCVLKEVNLKERHVIFSDHFWPEKSLPVKTFVHLKERHVKVKVVVNTTNYINVMQRSCMTLR